LGAETADSNHHFSAEIGLGETWDPEILRQAAAVEGYEARYMAQSEKYHKGGLVIFSPNSDLGRDPRWGRTEECYGEEPSRATHQPRAVHGRCHARCQLGYEAS